MGLRYCKNGKSWLETTREERLFCAELYFQMKKDLRPFIALLKEQMDDFPEDEVFELAFEVCFYRDLLHTHGKSARAEKLPYKRTFDLALLSNKTIVIIEAKAQQGFNNKQLGGFGEDEKHIDKAFKLIGEPVPRMIYVFLYSSMYGRRIRPETKKKLNLSLHLHWDMLADIYPEMKNLFLQADKSYGKGNAQEAHFINPFIAKMCRGVDKEYEVTIRDNICNGVYQDVHVIVHNATEFATVCKERFKKQTVSLISQAKCSDDLRDYVARAKDVDEITCVDLAWLAQEDDTAFRYAD